LRRIIIYLARCAIVGIALTSAILAAVGGSWVLALLCLAAATMVAFM
jgi:hypothetical protein